MQELITHFYMNNYKISFKELLKLLIDLVEPEEVEKLLLYQTCNGETFLHILSTYNKTILFKELLSFCLMNLKAILLRISYLARTNSALHSYMLLKKIKMQN